MQTAPGCENTGRWLVDIWNTEYIYQPQTHDPATRYTPAGRYGTFFRINCFYISSPSKSYHLLGQSIVSEISTFPSMIVSNLIFEGRLESPSYISSRRDIISLAPLSCASLMRASSRLSKLLHSPPLL